MRGRFFRHDTLVVLLKQAAAKAGIVASIEVTDVDHSHRIDVVLHFPKGRVWVDVSVVNPQAPSYIKIGAADARKGEQEGKVNLLAYRQQREEH